MRLIAVCVAVGFLLALAGCREPGLAQVSLDVTAEPSELRFEPAWVGYTTDAIVTLSSRSRVALDVQFETSAPFEVPVSALSLAGGARVDLPVVFRPTTSGAHEGTLRLRLPDGEHLEVALRGAAATPPGCGANQCQVAGFDPVNGTCTRTAKPDGTACSAACLTEAVCVDGECQGVTVGCDDGDACTVDACSASSGCVHAPVVCVAPSDPCLAAACDPVAGCVQHQVSDGTPCGEETCTVARVCVSGACVQRPVPDGKTCQQSPCAPEGVCSQGSCVQPAPTPIPVAWTYTAPTGLGVYFPGTIDDAGNHYFFECASQTSGCDLVSLDHDGALRFRARMTHQRRPTEYAGAVMIHGDLVLVTLGPDWVEARSRLDGSEVWERNLMDLVRPTFADPQSGGRLIQRAVLSGERLVVLADHDNDQANDGEGCWMVALDPATGAVSWLNHFQLSCGSTLVADESGTTYFGTHRLNGSQVYEQRLRSVLASGAPSWAATWSIPAPLAVSSTALFQYDETLVDTQNGGYAGGLDARAYAPIKETLIYSPVLSTGLSAAVRRESGARIYTIEGFEIPSGQRRWVQWLPWTWATQPIRTRTDALLVGGSSGSAQIVGGVGEIDADGEWTFYCQLEGGFAVTGLSTLHAGRWVAASGPLGQRTLVAYDVGPRAPATDGWITSGGNLQRTGAPLP